MYGIDIYKPSNMVFRECIKMRMGYIERPYPFIPTVIGYGSATGMSMKRITDYKWQIGRTDYPDGMSFSLLTRSVDMQSYAIDYFDVAIYDISKRTTPKYGIQIDGLILDKIHPEVITVEVVKTGRELMQERYIRVHHPPDTLGLIGEELLVFDGQAVLLKTGLGSVARRFNSYTSYAFPYISNPNYKYKAISHFLKKPTAIPKGYGKYGVEIYDDSGNVIYNSNTSQPVQVLGNVRFSLAKHKMANLGFSWGDDFQFKNSKITHVMMPSAVLPKRIGIINGQAKVFDVGYKIVDDILKVHYNVYLTDYRTPSDIPSDYRLDNYPEIEFVVFGIP